MRSTLTTIKNSIGFYTTIPVSHDTTRKRPILAWAAVVGILIGATTGVTYIVTAMILPRLVAATIAVTLTTIITGGLHEDGLTDTLDAFTAAWNKDETLSILHDTRTGTYGALGLTLITAAKITALAAYTDPHAALTAAIIAHTVSRHAASMFAYTAPYARANEAVLALIDDTPRASHIALSTAAALAPFLLIPESIAVLLLIIPGYLIITTYIKRRIHGYTGDTLGAVQQLVETTTLIALLA